MASDYSTVQEDTPDTEVKTCCYSCHKTLEPVSFGIAKETTQSEALKYEQWDNALIIVLEGGYAMFIDPISPEQGPDSSQGVLETNGKLKIVICHECAHDLCEKIPFFNKLIEPYGSHAHRHGVDWGEHQGWDLPHKPV